jgi:hypothetical protein
VDLIDEYAPGLRTLPDAFAQLRAFDLSDLQSTSLDTYVVLLVVGGLAYLIVCIAIRRVRLAVFPAPGATRKDGIVSLRHRRQPWHRRLKLWWAHRLDQPYYWKIGRWIADLNQTHGLVVGGSGSGKSTLVVSLILQPTVNLKMWLMRRLGIWTRRPVVIVSFDRSDPIEEATNVLEDIGITVERWRVRQANGWNLLDGDREMIAEALPEGWPHGDNTGFFQQLATDAVSAALEEQDAEGLPRDFGDMIERMDRIMADDPETPELARRTWVRRFRSLARVMGESIGQDFDLVSALKPGAVIHLSSNSYTNPALTPLVGAMAITQIKMAAETIGGVYLVLEEARFLKKRADLLDDLATSIRARGWRMAYLNQDPRAVGDTLQVNFGVAVFMGLGPLAQKARQWCADVVKGFPGAFRAEELVLGATIDQLEGYVLLNGRCRDVSLAPYITRAAEHRAAKGKPKEGVPPVAGTVDEDSGTVESGTVCEEQEKPDIPVWLTKDADRQRVWSRMKREACGCLRWQGGDNGAGRPKTHMTVRGADGLKRKTSPTVYVLTYEWVNGEDSAEPTLDHLCHTNDETCPGNDPCAWESCENPMHPFGEPCQHGLCCEDTHLEPVSIQVNQERNAAQKKRYQMWRARQRRSTLRLLTAEPEAVAAD